MTMEQAIRERRMVAVPIDYPMLIHLVVQNRLIVCLEGMPDDALVVRVVDRPERNQLTLVVAHPSFAAVCQGCELPIEHVTVRLGSLV